MTDNATLLALGCVGGIVLALGVGVFAVLQRRRTARHAAALA